MTHLSAPMQLGDVTVKNRLVMPPMVLFKGREAPWEPDQAHLEYYGRRAAAGTGLIIVEATAVDPSGRLAPFQLRAWDDSHIPVLACIAEAIKRHDTPALVQIHHAGANTSPDYLDGVTPASPSGVPMGRHAARELTGDEIERLIESYAAAATRCLRAGFDGVELHGAHGYLLNQFLSPAFNRRRDRWGGPAIEERLAFPLAVARAVRSAMGGRAILGYRLGAVEYIKDGLTLEEGLAAAKALEASGTLDVLHISRGYWRGKEPPVPPEFGFSRLMWLGAQVKKVVRLPVIAVGGIRTGGEAEAALAAGTGDLIAVGKAMLADPDWSAKALRGADQEIIPCRVCRRCMHFTDGERCPARGEGVK